MKKRFVGLTIAVLALLAWSVVYPNASVVAGSFAHGLTDWRAFFSSPADHEALINTIIISVASVFASLAIGIPLAFLLTRFDFRGRRVMSAFATLPAALPPLVGVIAFLFLYGESGVVTRARAARVRALAPTVDVYRPLGDRLRTRLYDVRVRVPVRLGGS